jgi:hypothetical protein
LNKAESLLLIECDLPADLPLQSAELKLVLELLPELLKDMLWLQDEKE